jgi:hypothetical protein
LQEQSVRMTLVVLHLPRTTLCGLASNGAGSYTLAALDALLKEVCRR